MLVAQITSGKFDSLQHKSAKKVLSPYENTVFSSSIRNAAGE